MITANSIAEQVAANPVIWSGVIGACVALFSNVLLAVFNAWYAAREKSRDRTMTLRKEVYLPLIGSIPAVWSALCKLPNTPQFDEKPMNDFGSYANRLAVVAETQTAIIAMELATKTATTFMDLMSLAIPAHQSLTDASIAKEYRVKFSQKGDLVQAKIDEHLQAGKGADANFEALTKNLKYHHERSQEYWERESAAINQHAVFTLAYIRKLIAILPQLDTMRVKLLLALRRDVEVRTSEKDFKAALQNECAQMISSLENFVASLEKQLQAAGVDNS
jgi:hypothetical protein